MTELGQDRETFKFFLAFASEVMDGYGRFLGYLHPHQQTPPRKLSYNERMLGQGWATLYFIWPNLDPYRRQTSPVDAVPQPGSVSPEGVAAAAKQPLDDARASVRNARDHQLGIWDKTNPLRCNRSSCASSRAAPRQTGGSLTSPPATTSRSIHSSTTASRTPKTAVRPRTTCRSSKRKAGKQPTRNSNAARGVAGRAARGRRL